MTRTKSIFIETSDGMELGIHLPSSMWNKSLSGNRETVSQLRLTCVANSVSSSRKFIVEIWDNRLRVSEVDLSGMEQEVIADDLKNIRGFDSLDSPLDVCLRTKEGGFKEWLTGRDVYFLYDRRSVMDLGRSANNDWTLHATNYGKIEISYDNGRDFRTWMLNIDQEDLTLIRELKKIVIDDGRETLHSIFNKIDELGVTYFRVDGWG